MAEKTPPTVSDGRPGPAAGPTGRRRREQAAAVVAAVAAVSVIAAAAISGVDGDRGNTSSGDPGSDMVPVALHEFDGCDDVLEHFRDRGAQAVGPWGLEGSGPVLATGAERDLSDGSNAPGRAPALDGTAKADAGGASASASGSGTNVQVAGVDEADLAKRSGDLLLTVAERNGLRILRTSPQGTALLARLPLEGWLPESLLVEGDTVLLMGRRSANPAGSGDRKLQLPLSSDSRLAQIDISTPTRPVLVRTLDVEGSVTGARLVDGVARLAVTTDPVRLPTTTPSDGGQAARDRALEANRKVVAESTVETWLPRYTLRGPSGAVERTGQAVTCDAVAAPGQFSGLSTLSLLSFALRDGAGVAQWESAAVIARGGTLYATADHTWVATSEWRISTEAIPRPGSDVRAGVPAATERTSIHLFDTTGRQAPRYLASGQVPGILLNQFSLDEHAGHLRVATTTSGTSTAVDRADDLDPDDAPTAGSAEGPASESRVTVLRRDGDRLRRVGDVGGLGRGEQIRSVRFLGDRGYVVTFRQTDPLYVVDLRTPTAPRVTGELKILGYSGYLHPAGGDTLLGVGRDADAQGTVEGLQVSLFDVSDPASPKRLDRADLPGAWSDVEGDHHAFTLAGDLVLVPFQRMGKVELPKPSEQLPRRTAPDDPVSQDPTGAPGAEGSAGSTVATPTGPVASAASTAPASPGTSNGSGSNGSPSDGSGSDAALPVPAPDFAPPTSWESGLVALRSSAKGLGEPVVLHPTATGRATVRDRTGAWDPAVPLRSYVGDGTLWVLTTAGVATYDAKTLTFRSFLSL
ncbi:MAG: beta-propeller protein [Actinomycetota bacterium]|nr:beta-propeller protein [Actinomycetota bacterium]